jgi:hypothetical protein
MTKSVRYCSVVKDRLFYNRYEYCISFVLDEVTCLKQLDHDYIDALLARRAEWSKIHRQRQQATRGGIAFPTMHTRLALRPMITKETSTALHALADQLLTTTHDYKLVTSVNRAWIYSNSTDLMLELNENTTLKDKFFTRAVIDRPHNTIRLKNSLYQQRSYFKVLKLTSQQKHTLSQFFANQQDQIRLSPALREWFADDYLRTQDYFFIDHHGEGWLVMLALVHGGIIRKTVDIVTG